MSNKKCLLEFFPRKRLREWEGEGKEIKQGWTTRPSCTDTIQQQSSYYSCPMWGKRAGVLSSLSFTDVSHWLRTETWKHESLCLQVESALCVSLREAHWWRPKDTGHWGNKKHTPQELHTVRWTTDLKHDSIWVVGSGIVKVRGFANIIKAHR